MIIRIYTANAQYAAISGGDDYVGVGRSRAVRVSKEKSHECSQCQAKNGSDPQPKYH